MKSGDAGTDSSGLIVVLDLVGRLKHMPRTGWLDRGVPTESVESVADHSFRVALLAWLAAAADPSLNRDRVLKLALIHDLAESAIGDRTPYDRVQLAQEPDAQRRRAFLNRRHLPGPERAAEKRSDETAAFSELIELLPATVRDELSALWQELADRVTPESRFVKQADRLETYLQSVEYLREDPGLPMDSFRLEVDETIDIPILVALRDAIRTGQGE